MVILRIKDEDVVKTIFSFKSEKKLISLSANIHCEEEVKGR